MSERGLRMSRRMAVFSIAIAMFGCSESGPKMYPVTGKVIHKGKPLTAGTVMFVPDAAGPTASGEIGEDGTYTLQALPGSYRVALSAMIFPQGADGPGEMILPDSYGSEQTSGLTATVKEDDSNVVDFNLDEKPGKTGK